MIASRKRRVIPVVESPGEEKQQTGGVQETNLRGIHFYTKAGFVKVGEFYTDKNNWDMLVEL